MESPRIDSAMAEAESTVGVGNELRVRSLGLLEYRHLHSELRGPNGAHITAGATADHDNVIPIRHCCLLSSSAMPS